MSDVTLSAAVRNTLLSLQNTSVLIDRTQNRLSTGLRVASAQDDPISFFQAKTLDDRSLVFTEKKDGIDQGISSLATALEGVSAIENLVRQLKGLASSLKSSTGTQFTDLITQYNALRTQIGTLADDTTYQGTNLVNSTSESLSVSFSDKTASLLTVASVNVRQSGLAVSTIAAAAATSFDYSAAASFNFQDVVGAGGTTFTYSADTAVTISNTGATTILLTYQGSAQSIDSAGITVSYGTLSVTLSTFDSGNGTGASVSIASGDVITVTLTTGSDESLAANFNRTAFAGVLATGALTGGAGIDIAAEERVFLSTAATALNSTAGGTLSLTYKGSQQTVTSAAISVTYGTVTVSVSVGTGDASGLVISGGDVITVQLNTLNDSGFLGGISATAASGVSIDAQANVFLGSGSSTDVDVAIAELDSAITTLRSSAQTLGSNIALLQTRLDFTELYVDELDGGSAKLVLADINEEGANLLALQTRQQLGISALAFAGQAEQGILALFR